MKTLVFWVLLTGCQEVLLGDLPEVEANDVVAALGASGIEADKEAARAGRFRVAVPRGSVGSAWTVLQGAGLPRPLVETPPDRLVVGPTEAKLLHQQQQARALERVLRGLPEVRDARVALTAEGVAVVIRGTPDPEKAQALVRTAVPANAKISLRIEGLAPPPALVAPRSGMGALTGLSVAVVALAAACVLLLVRLRRVSR